MASILDTDAENPGPSVLGHDPVLFPNARETVTDAVEQTGVVEFRDSAALPWLKNPGR